MGRKPNHTKLLLALLAMLAVMVALVAASVPLYRLFCNVTGYGGTTRRAELAPALPASAREVTVSFDGNVDPALPWEFGPEVKSVKVKLGAVTTINYKATNRGTQTLTGTATYNVQPDKAGPFFDKIQCFCFSKQTLKPGESEELPVQFLCRSGAGRQSQ